MSCGTGIISVEYGDGTLMSVVDFGGIKKKDVCLQYIPDAEVGQYVVVPAGFRPPAAR